MPRTVDSLTLLSTVVGDSPIGFAVFDRDLRFVYLNRSLAALNRRPIADHLGRRLTDMFDAQLAVSLEEPIERVILTGEPDHDVAYTAELPEGTRHFLIDRYPIRNAAGDVVAAAVTVNEVTERRRLAAMEREAQRLRETAQLAYQLDAAQRIAGIGSWEFDLTTGAVIWSRQMCALLGLDRTPADYEATLRLVHPDDVPAAKHYLARLVQTGEPYTVESRMVRADGSLITVITNAEPVLDDSGRVVRILGTTYDMTRQRAVEAEAHQARLEVIKAHAQMESERQVLRLFQRAMLPAQLPELPGAELAVAYRPLSPEMDIGGDWYDAYPLPDGRVVLSIGDIAGHDMRAAAVVGQIRSAIRAYAMLDPAPGPVLQHTNRLLRHRPEVVLASMLFGLYEPESRQLTWAAAGHPPPVLRRGEAAELLPTVRQPMLGAVDRDRPYAEQRVVLDPDDVLVWYTDGLVERRTGELPHAIDRLAALLSDAGDRPADALAGHLIEACLKDGQQSDDVCLLVLKAIGGGT